MKNLLLIFTFLMSVISLAQTDSMNFNTADRLLKSNTRLSIGGYAEVDYNQQIDEKVRQNGNVDVHRVVLMFGYKFNKRTNFITEIEMEHVKEIYVEQAFLQYRINPSINLRAGLMLVPMGIVNEFHEPTTFNGVERPDLDKYVVPTTWRENGIGLQGTITDLSLKYQAYIMNGFKGHDGNDATFGAKNGLRSGRQKGAESFISSPTFSSKVDYYGIKGLKVGVAGYIGNSQTEFYNGLDKDDDVAIKSADSTVVGIAMIGFNAIYTLKGFQFRGQYNQISINNSDQYNAYFGSDLGKSIMGFYGELSYNVFNKNKKKNPLTPFVRYEKFNTHQAVESGTLKAEQYNRSSITFGLGWKMAPGAVLKSDYQVYSDDLSGSSNTNKFNLGVGVWF